jgi:hypothetical protein
MAVGTGDTKIKSTALPSPVLGILRVCIYFEQKARQGETEALRYLDGGDSHFALRPLRHMLRLWLLGRRCTEFLRFLLFLRTS